MMYRRMGPKDLEKVIMENKEIQFNKLIYAMTKWRDEDHEDAMKLNRNEVCVLLDGIKASTVSR